MTEFAEAVPIGMPVSPRFFTLIGFVHVFLFDKSLAHENAGVNIPVTRFVKFSKRAQSYI